MSNFALSTAPDEDEVTSTTQDDVNKNQIESPTSTVTDQEIGNFKILKNKQISFIKNLSLRNQL